jgi:hypothetical protein
MPHPILKWVSHPNLRRRRPGSPNKGRGRIQVQIRRAFVAADSDTLSSSEVFDWVFACPGPARQSAAPAPRSAIRVLRQIAETVGRAPTIGRPWLWRLKPNRAQTDGD